MNIAFLTTLDPYDISNWSGTTNHLLQTLKKKHHVQVIGNDILPQVSFNVRNNFLKMKLPDHYSQVLGKLCAEQLSDCDLVFFGDLYLAPFLDVDVPFVHLSDVSYHSFLAMTTIGKKCYI